MRQSQQKNRMRGRGRKQGNPLSRNFESNGPDVKIRGNASHVAEKYMTLARDASAAGDVVMSENYLQHAEHYNRIVATANAANQQRNEEQANRGQQPDVSGFDGENDDDDGNNNNNDNDNRSARGNRNDTQDAATGNQDDSGRQQDRKPRRDPRNRRPRRNPGDDENAGAKSQGNGASAKGNGHADHGSADAPSGVSSDAAKLPGSLIGAVEEGPVTETAGDD